MLGKRRRRKSTQTNLQQINSTKKIIWKKFKNPINKSTKHWSYMKKNHTITFIQLLRTKKN